MTQSDKECMGGGGEWRGRMQHNMYAVGDQLRVKRSEWTVMIFFQKKQHIDYIEKLISHLINWSIDQS